MTVTRFVLPPALKAAAQVLVLSLAALGVVACSSNSNRSVDSIVGIDDGVAISTTDSVTSIQEATTLALTASVTSDTNSQGVTWSMTGVGSLSAVTKNSATFNAPSAVTGADSAVITATSIADSTKTASVTLVVLGSPVINGVSLFPANKNVAYAADISVTGGVSPFAWKLVSGSLPSGITLSSSTTSLTAISGTATQTGTFTFELQATDTDSRVATVDLTLVVNPEAACILTGHYNFLFSGFRGNSAATHAGSIDIDSSGNVSGIQDYKDGNRTTSGETLTSGTCTNRSTNSGVLTFKAPSGSLLYDFSATPPDSSGVIHSARIELIHSGSDSGSGEMTLTDTTAITGTPPNGDFAFGLVSVDGNQSHYGEIGRFTSDTSGNLSAGLVDSNNATTPLTDATLSGTLSAPDANGRGTLTLVSGSDSSTLAYYITSASKLYLINIDQTTGGSRQTGYATAQTGNVSAGAFDAGALTSPSIVSLYGRIADTEPVSVMSLGRLANGDATGGTVDLTLDTSNQATATSDLITAAQPYTVDTNGRGTLAVTNSGGVSNYVFYLDGTADGYILQQGSTAGSVGLLEAQTAQSGGVYSDNYTGAFVGGTQFAQAPGPISLNPLVYLSFGSLSSTYTSGTFAIDDTTGRGLGTLSQTGVGTTAASLYVVSPTKIDVLRFGTRAIDGTIEWLIQ